MGLTAGPMTSVIALETAKWDEFYSSLVKPIAQFLIPLAIALVVLIAVSGLLTRFMVRPGAKAWCAAARCFWKVVGGFALLAVAAFLPIYGMFRPFNDGVWLTWAFPFGVVALGVALVVLGSRVRVRWPTKVSQADPVMPRPTFWLLLLLWAGLVSCFFSWGAGQRLLVAYVALAVLGLTASATALGQNLRLQVEAQAADGKAEASAADYVLAQLQSLGSVEPDAVGISRGSDLSKLVSEDLSAIPVGPVAAAAARVMYAIRPGLTWRARLSAIDADRVAVTLTRNGLHVRSTVISRPDLGLPLLTPDVTTPRLEEEQGRARSQLLTGAAACILVELSHVHPKLTSGLCGAKQWKSVALQVIASEPTLKDDPLTRIKLLRTSVNLEPQYGLARLDYLLALFAQTPKTIANRMRFARLLDAQLQLCEEGQTVRKGWERIHMRVLYSRAAMRINAYLMALAESDQRTRQLCQEQGDILAAARESATRLAADCRAFMKDGKNARLSRHAAHMAPVAESLQSAIGFLTDQARQAAAGGNWTWMPPEPELHPGPNHAGHYAALAMLAEDHDVPRGHLSDARDYLAFTRATRQDLQGDPSFWTLLRNPERAAGAKDVLGLEPAGMLELPPFKLYADKLAKAGITTYKQLQLRASDDALRKAMADYLATSSLVVSHLVDIAELASTHDDLASAEVLQVFLRAGITSRGALSQGASDPYLVGTLRSDAESYGLAGLAAFKYPHRWLVALRAV